MLELLKAPKTFLHKATKHNKTYMEGLNSKNKKFKVADPLNKCGFIVFCYVSQTIRKMFRKLKKLSYMSVLIYNLVTWFEWSMA